MIVQIKSHHLSLFDNFDKTIKLTLKLSNVISKIEVINFSHHSAGFLREGCVVEAIAENNTRSTKEKTRDTCQMVSSHIVCILQAHYVGPDFVILRFQLLQVVDD